MTAFSFRHLRQEDKASVRLIAADTAFFGEPVEAFLDDRELFNDTFTAYYLDYASEYCWVACRGEKVIGYLLGCLDTASQQKTWAGRILPDVLKKFISGRYRFGSKTFFYSLALGISAIKRELTQIDLSRYPAHLHINIDQEWRGQGIGRKLLEGYIQQIHSTGAPGIHLHTTSYNRAACFLYESIGFQALDHRKTGSWSRWVQAPIENIGYGLRLETTTRIPK